MLSTKLKTFWRQTGGSGSYATVQDNLPGKQIMLSARAYLGSLLFEMLITTMKAVF